MNIRFLNWSKEDFLELKYLYRYMEFNDLEEMLKTNTINFKDPKKWIDPYETRMLVRKYKFSDDKPINYPFNDSLSAYCFTSPENCEAHWKVYNRETIIVQVSFIVEKLLEKLNISNEIPDLYIGQVEYFKKNEIDKEAVKILNKEPSLLTDEDWLKIMLLKRITYKYEKEIRFMTINGGGHELPKLVFDNIKDVIEHVTIEPQIDESDKDDILKKKSILKKYGLDVSESQLYYKAKEYKTLKIN